MADMSVHMAGGILLAHMVPYWGTVALLAALIPAQRPPRHIVVNVVFNQLCIFLAMALFLLCVAPHLPLPAPSESELHGIWEISAAVVITDPFFYVVHRLFHLPWAYARFHWAHHELTRPPIGSSALLGDPLDVTCINALPVVLGGLVMGMGVTTMRVWVGIASVNLVVAHTFPGRQRRHHRDGHGDFGIGLHWVDWVLGTRTSK